MNSEYLPVIQRILPHISKRTMYQRNGRCAGEEQRVETHCRDCCWTEGASVSREEGRVWRAIGALLTRRGPWRLRCCLVARTSTSSMLSGRSTCRTPPVFFMCVCVCVTSTFTPSRSFFSNSFGTHFLNLRLNAFVAFRTFLKLASTLAQSPGDSRTQQFLWGHLTNGGQVLMSPVKDLCFFHGHGPDTKTASCDLRFCLPTSSKRCSWFRLKWQTTKQFLHCPRRHGPESYSSCVHRANDRIGTWLRHCCFPPLRRMQPRGQTSSLGIHTRVSKRESVLEKNHFVSHPLG